MSSTGQEGESARDVRLAQALVALADTLVDDFDIVGLMDDLVRTCVELLPGTAAGLLLRDGDELQVVAATGEDVRLLELFQVQGDEGPCLDAIHTAQPVTVDDLSTEKDRWPGFCAAAERAGFLAVQAVPMRLRKEVLGGLNVFRPDGPAFSAGEQQIVQALADIATIGILQQRSVHRSGLLAEQLQVALASRVVIEQAKGILAEQGKTDLQQAFARVRRYARNNNLPLSQVARQVVDGRLAFEQLS